MNAARGLAGFSKGRRRLRGWRLRLWIRAWGGSAGRRLEVEPGVRLRRAPSRRWRIGDDVYLGFGAILDILPGAELVIGDRAKVMHHVVIAAAESITIGVEAQIAEACSIRDGDHGREPGSPIRDQPIVSSPVVIGDGAWIARGVAVLRGANVGSRAVVGANAVVRGDVPAGATAVGVPARVL